MDRRRFLKGVGLAGAAGVAGAAGLRTGTFGSDRSKPVRGREAVAGAARFRVDGSSRVYVSHDGGATWATHATFPKGVALKSVHADGAGRVRLRAAYAGHGFGLALARGGRNWHTA